LFLLAKEYLSQAIGLWKVAILPGLPANQIVTELLLWIMLKKILTRKNLE
jgi:hypothetical protein